MVANMRAWAKEIDAVSGPHAFNPLWCELPGHGTRNKEPLSPCVADHISDIARVVAAGVLANDRTRPFFIFGFSVGTLHAFELARELERLGFSPRGLVVLNRNAPQIPMDGPDDNFTKGVSDDSFVEKMSSEYGQKTLLDMWKSHPDVVKAALPVSRNDMQLLTEYRLERPGERLKCAIICAGCTRDRPSNNEAAVRAWSECTDGPTEFRMFDGNHFVFPEQPKIMTPWLVEQMVRHLKK